MKANELTLSGDKELRFRGSPTSPLLRVMDVGEVETDEGKFTVIQGYKNVGGAAGAVSNVDEPEAGENKAETGIQQAASEPDPTDGNAGATMGNEAVAQAAEDREREKAAAAGRGETQTEGTGTDRENA